MGYLRKQNSKFAEPMCQQNFVRPFSVKISERYKLIHVFEWFKWSSISNVMRQFDFTWSCVNRSCLISSHTGRSSLWESINDSLYTCPIEVSILTYSSLMKIIFKLVVDGDNDSNLIKNVNCTNLLQHKFCNQLELILQQDNMNKTYFRNLKEYNLNLKIS